MNQLYKRIVTRSHYVYCACIFLTLAIAGQAQAQQREKSTTLAATISVTPDSLYEEVEKGSTSTRIFTITNNDTENQPFTIRTGSNGAAANVLSSLRVATRQSLFTQTFLTEKEAKDAMRELSDPHSKRAVRAGIARRMKTAAQALATTVQYATDFESFSPGSIYGQEGWSAFGNHWNITSVSPFNGQQHMRGVTEDLNLSLALSPIVPIGTDSLSAVTMKLSVTGTGVMWQVIPQSNTAGLLNTRIQFGSDNRAYVMVDDGAGGERYDTIQADVPDGYFDLTIEMNRATALFDVYFNNNKVYTGQGFAGDIEQVVFFSTQNAASTLDIDNFQLMDGPHDVTSFISISPVSGTILAGASQQISVGFDATNLAYGKYATTVYVNTAEGELALPVSLNVTGDPAIEVFPESFAVTANYKEDVQGSFKIINAGGAPLNFSATVTSAQMPDPDEWITLTPASGSVSPGAYIDIVTTFSNAAVEPGNYYADIHISSNALTDEPITVRGILLMREPAEAFVGVDSIYKEMQNGTQYSSAFTLNNFGESYLHFTITHKPAWMSLNHMSGTLEGTTSETGMGILSLAYTLDASSLSGGFYQDTLLMQTSDPTKPVITIPVTMKVLPIGPVQYFSLINIFTKKVITDFKDSLVIDVSRPDFLKLGITFNTTPAPVGSVVFKIDGIELNTDNIAPYQLMPLILPLLNKGAHKLVAQTYTGSNKKGKPGVPLEVTIVIDNLDKITGFEVVNKQGQKLMSLEDGSYINLAEPSFKSISIRAETASAYTGSVKFYLNGFFYRIDSQSPYLLTSDLTRYFIPWTAKEGHYRLVAVPYSLAGGMGIAGQATTISFDAGKGAYKATSARVNELSEEEVTTSVVLYPVPVDRTIQLKLRGELTGKVSIVILNMQGQSIYTENIVAEQVSDHQIDLSTLGLSKGVYYLQLQDTEGFRNISKFIKQ